MKSREIKNTVYSSNYRCNVTIFTALVALMQQAIVYRWQIWLSVKKKIQATYNQDTFGLFWSIVMPIIPMTVYMVLAQIKVLKTVDNMPFVFYIGIGMLVWLMMATSIHTMLKAIKSEKSILTTTNFPIFPILISRLGEVLNDTIIRFIIVGIIILWYHIDITFYGLVLALFSLIPAIIFAMGLGMLLSILDVIIQDTRRVVLLILRYGLFLSSVIFPFPEIGIAGFLNDFNFFNTFVNAARDLLHHGSIHQPLVFFTTSLVGIIIFAIASKLIYTMDYKIRAYL
jgi:ABC-type polysaccharide/polyol phosphate export permease